MKKNISINIGGIIFHIEEDGYDKLKNYLDSINKYFSSFEDSKEIIDDIEGRIAEIFLSKLEEGKQIITPEDVNDLIATMGTTKDFEASIESEPEPEPKKEEEKAKEEPKDEPKDSYEKAKRLYRDSKRKVIGGVAAGIANYFGIDPIWVRLLMLAFLFNIFFWGLSGFIFLTYIILWIAIPASDKLEDDKAIKKLFRSTDDRVLGGVSGGIASYFGTDPVVIRVLFVVSIFLGGAGLLAYIILWIITPEAKSITEKMQMQGEPVTISNIEENVKKSLNVKEGEENVFVKILLFPFRLIAIIFKALGEILGPLLKFSIEALRIAVGVFLVFLGFVLMICFTISLAVLLGVGGAMDAWVHFGDFPAQELFSSLSTVAIISCYITSMVPSLAILLVGLIVITKKKVTSAFVAWGLFGLWLLGMIGLAVSVPSIIRNYSVEGTYQEERRFALNEGITELKFNELDWDSYNSVDLKIRGHEDSAVYLLELEFDARGYSRTNAKENGEAVDYVVTQEGDDFYFDSEITFGDAPFRFQDVEATFYIPYGKVFRMDYDLRKILRNTLWMHGYNAGDMGDNDWVFDEDGLRCLTCDNSKRKSKRGAYSSDSQSYEFSDFDEVVLISLFDFQVTRGNNYAVRLEGDDDDLDEVYLQQNGDELEIRYGRNTDWWKNRKRRDKIKVFIEMPELEYLKATGACEGEIRNFEGSDIELDIEGASEVWADLDAENLRVDLTGASELILVGRGTDLKADLSGASELDAFNFIVEDANINANGASTAKVYVKNELEADASGASKVRYRGDARVSSDSNGLSSIRKD
ncbi:phage shock protein C (PspC) family protein [Ekhidna lutea]|uniref:Phage shock protein C (PspC) family protein n=1 Tax=Ekhidna lutea TaxID=447679 RepID=A0A239KG74_EKHLU|nr:PspC domain-containing protein [Ekhidna lutea]SNT16649.1 phage shock protein C (PspC) family protein [Ekhidna lutea]